MLSSWPKTTRIPEGHPSRVVEEPVPLNIEECFPAIGTSIDIQRFDSNSDSMSPVDADPRAEYQQLLEARRSLAFRLSSVSRRFSWLRFGLGVGAAIAAWMAVAEPSWSGLWFLLSIVAFLIAAVLHERVERRRKRAEVAAVFYRAGLARIADAWAGQGPTGERFADADHLYSSDLDLFGSGSLFQLLAISPTGEGQRTLARWLCSAAGPQEIRRRQMVVEELRSCLDLREDLAILGGKIDESIDFDGFRAWAAKRGNANTRWPALMAAVLALANLAALSYWSSHLIDFFSGPESGRDSFFGGALPLFMSSMLSACLVGLYLSSGRRVRLHLDPLVQDLEALVHIFARVEGEEFEAPLWRDLRARLDTTAVPSKTIARLVRLVQTDQSRKNPFFRAIAGLLLPGTQLTLAFERWRLRFGPEVADWLEALGEMEALSALSGYAYEHPEDPFPEIIEDGPCFEAKELAHPLIPRSESVSNDLSIGRDLRLLLISGSNMSGKSTLLRTIGVNVVLALAGAPVRAQQLRVSPMVVGTAMRIVDSLRQGVSHFYAELRRLRAIIGASGGEVPVFFLLDEILHGTNSHDRRIGAAAVVKELIGAGAVGLVTTHDLALTQIATDLGQGADNAHFTDRLDEGRIYFDYKLRSGVVERGNALELMRSVGLEV